MVSDRLYDYEFALRNTEKLLNQDPKIRAADRKLIQAFMRHIKAQGVSVGRQGKYLNHLRRSAQLIPVPFSKAKREDIEELITRLTDFEWFVKRKDGTIARRTRYSAETMAEDSLQFHVAGLTVEQTRRYALPENFERPGQWQWEALSDAQAREVIQGALERFLDLGVGRRDRTSG